MYSIRTRLLALTTGGAAALILVGLFALSRFSALSHELTATDHKGQAMRSQTLMDMMHDALHSDALNALMATTPAEIADARKDTGEHTAWFKRELDTLRGSPLPRKIADDVSALVPQLDAYVGTVNRLVDAAATDHAQAIALRGDVEASFHQLEGTLETLGEEIEHMGGDLKQVEARTERARFGVIVICLVAAFLTIGGGLLISRKLVASLKKTAAVVQAMAEGDIRQRLTVDDRSEVGAMMTALNASLEQIGEMLENIRASSREVLETSNEVDQVASTLARNNQRAGEDATNAATAAAQASGNVQTVAAATEEIAATIRDVARNAQEAARVAAGGVAIASRSNASVARLGTSSNEIGAVVEVITQIAEQTNLLALNATIEAARAGAAGRGFAVVANEIKELAKQTARATEEIRTKIVGIQRDTEEAVKDIGQIGEVIGQIDGIQQSIAAAVAQQAAVTSDIGRNLTEVAAAADTIARDISAADHAIRDNATVATRASAAAGTLGNLAKSLEQSVEFFRMQPATRSVRVVPPPSQRIEVVESTERRPARVNGSNGHRVQPRG